MKDLLKTVTEPCDKCLCWTWTMMDKDGNRTCGKCGREKRKDFKIKDVVL